MLTSRLAAFKSDPLLPLQITAKVRSMVSAYFKALSAALVESHKKLSAREKKAESERIMRGELSETSTKQLGELQARHESLLSGTTSLASALGEKMPELQDEDDDEMDDLSGGVKLLNLWGHRFRRLGCFGG